MTLFINTLFKLTTKQAQCQFNAARLIGVWLGWAILVAAFIQPAAGQEVITHLGFPDAEDGDPKKDADGVKDGMVTWKGGVVHVIAHTSVNVTHVTLILQSGAIVKIAAKFDTAKGKLTWEPALGDGGMRVSADGALQINGATITDIRDDKEGGDTNQDGDGSSPPPPNLVFHYLSFSGTGRDFITNSKLKYIGRLEHLGSMNIVENTFFMFGEVRPLLEPITVDAIPVIKKNTFEFNSSDGSINLLGMSPIVEENTFRYAPGVTSNSGGKPTIVIGPAREYADNSGRLGPQSGFTIIVRNIIEKIGGIELVSGADRDSLYAQIRFQAEIRDNKLRGVAVGGSGATGLNLAILAQATVIGNEVNNFRQPLRLYEDKSAVFHSALKINQNVFTSSDGLFGPSLSSANYWKKGIFINAEDNFWSDPTGPFDNSNADGFYNPRGKGLKIGDGIDYEPFIGGTAPPKKDKLSISVLSNPIPPLTPNSNVTFNVSATYQLESAANGQIFVNIRDDNGYILNAGQSGINVTSQNHSTNFPPIPIQIPALNKAITVEAKLEPERGEAVSSNTERFEVKRPTSNFSMSVSPATFTRGSKAKVKLTFNYNLATANNGRFEVELKERVRDLGTDLKNFPSLTVDAPPGNNKTAAGETELDIPLRDVLREPSSELYCQVTFRDGAGVAVGKEARSISIVDGPNTVRFEILAPGKFNSNLNTMESLGRIHYLIGEVPSYAFLIRYRIGTPNVTGWQVRVGDDRALDAAGKTLYQYTANRPAVDNASTGPEQSVRSILIGQGASLPTETKKYRAFVRLVAPSDITVAYATYDVEVRDQPTQSAQKAVPAGASQIAFTPIPVTLNFASNQKAGRAFAEEFSGQFGATAASMALAKTNTFYWKFIPLKRYWAVYDTLKDGTFSATVSFTYNPATDFPNVPAFKEDSLVVAGFNPLSRELEALPSTLNKATHTITTAYTKFFDTYVVASKATVLTTATSSKPDLEIPAQFSLAQNYPNPFNPTTVISFQLPVNSHVTLKVFDVFGREVVTLVDKKYSAGRYDVHWDATGHASGVYFYRLQAEESFVQTKKLLLVK